MGGWDWLIGLVVVPVLMLGFYTARGAWWDRGLSRQIDLLDSGGRASFLCRARGDLPYPSRWTKCRLELAADGSALVPQVGSGPIVNLPGGRLDVVMVRRVRRSDRIRAGDDAIVIVTRDGAESELQLSVHEDQEQGVLAILDRAGHLPGPAVATPVASSSGRRWWRAMPSWAKACGLAGVFAGLVVVMLWTTSQPVEVRVTGEPDEFDECVVTWTDPWEFHPREAAMTCYAAHPGDTLPGFALGRPFRGAIFDTDSFLALGMFVVLPLIVTATVGLVGQAWRDRRTLTAKQEPDVVANLAVTKRDPDIRAEPASYPPIPHVDGATLDLQSAAAVAAARSARERWRPGRRLGPGQPISEVEQRPWWALPTAREALTMQGKRAVYALLPLLAAVTGGWTAWDGWLVSQIGEVATAAAEPGYAESFIPLFPDDLEVMFSTVEGEHTAWVALVGAEPQSNVVVEYDVRNPERARLVGPGDGTVRGVVLSGLLGAGALGWIGWCLSRATASTSRLRGALHSGMRQRVAYVLVADPDGDPALLLLPEPSRPPRWAIPLAEPVLGAVPLTGTVEVRGDLYEEAVVVASVPERVLWPARQVAELDLELAMALVTGRG